MARSTTLPTWVNETVTEFMALARTHQMGNLDQACSVNEETDLFLIDGDFTRRFAVTTQIISGANRVPDQYLVSAAIRLVARGREAAQIIFCQMQSGVWHARAEIGDATLPYGREASELADQIGIVPDDTDGEIAARIGFAPKTRVIFRNGETVRFMLDKAIRITRLRAEIAKIAAEPPPRAAEVE